MMDTFWTLEFYQDDQGQQRIAIVAGDSVVFSLYAHELDKAYKMAAWRNDTLSRAFYGQRQRAA